MGISRTGSCPAFLEYVTRRALVPRAAQPTPEFLRLTEFNFQWIDIPSYQRGLVWDDDLFEELLNSTSVFLGNAIFGAFDLPADRRNFENLPASANQYEILIDGLQRFSIGTALLRILHPMVIAEEPGRPDDVPHFAALRAQCSSLAAVYMQNDQELSQHARKAVRDSYRRFRETLCRWVENEFNHGKGEELAQKVNHIFLGRQVAPDTYHGFPSPYAVTNTFIGLNTVRVQLNIVDWLRSIVVDHGSSSGWDPVATEELENRFTEVFTKEGSTPQRELIPLAAIVKEGLASGNDTKAQGIFPSWGSMVNPTFSIDEVSAFLDFVEAVFNFTGNPYFDEARSCGAIPFAGLICHYYRILLATGQKPGFLDGGEMENSDLLAYLRGYYRVVFDGHVARTRAYAERLLYEDVDLPTIASELSNNYLNRPLEQTVDRDWLVAMLKQADQKRSRQVFNACRLPEHGNISPFNPDTYGRKGADSYQIDHLLPDSAIEENQPGEPEAQLLMNFAPIRRTVNNKQTNLACSAKLAEGGSFANEVINNDKVHPYIRWLVEAQAQHGSFLDQQRLLQPNSDPPIADERITWIADYLLGRL